MGEMRFPQADFSINRKCTDTEAILDWQEEERVVDISEQPWTIRDWLDEVPKGVPRVPIPQQYDRDLFNDSVPRYGSYV